MPVTSSVRQAKKFILVLVPPKVQPEYERFGEGWHFQSGGYPKAGSRTGSDCDHEGSFATWLWSFLGDQISSFSFHTGELCPAGVCPPARPLHFVVPLRPGRCGWSIPVGPGNVVFPVSVDFRYFHLLLWPRRRQGPHGLSLRCICPEFVSCRVIVELIFEPLCRLQLLCYHN